MRHKEPQHVTIWRDKVASPQPRCCHTCDWYEADGVCGKHLQRPPEDFASAVDSCPDWLMEVPF
jgi:hypothetical protein